MKRPAFHHHLLKATAGALILGALAGCVETSRPGNISSVDFHHNNWWNLYNRGIGYMAEENYAEARSCFEKALGLVPGARYGMPDEQWRIRTYGLHILNNYFPHRELGVCCYHLGQLKQAETYLDKSLEITSSGRARFYLDQTRRKQLAGMDAAPPRFVVHEPLPAGPTSAKQENISVTIDAEAYVSEVVLNGKRLVQDGAVPSFELNETIRLNPGTNHIQLTAVDLKGQSNAMHWTRIADWTPPEALLDMIPSSSPGSHMAKGRFYDDHGIQSITLDGETVYAATLDAAHREVVKTLTLSDQTVTGEIIDVAGNRTSLTIDGQLFAAAPASPEAATPARYRGDGHSIPLIQLPQKRTVVFGEEYLLEGRMASAAGLKEADINGTPLLQEADAGTRHKQFSRRMPLRLGINSFIVSATDRNGVSDRKTVIVERRQPEKLDRQYRLALRLLPFIDPVGNKGHFQLPLRLLEETLLNPPARFWLIESADGWEAVLREHALSLSDLADPRAALTAGKLLQADLLCIGQIIPHDTGHTLLMSVVDAHNQVIHLSDMYTDEKSGDLAYCMEGWTRKLEQTFPILEGRIIGRQRNSLGINLGSDDGLRSGLRFLVLRPQDPEDPDSATVLTLNQHPLELLVNQTGLKAATGTLNFPESMQTVQEGDLIYAR